MATGKGGVWKEGKGCVCLVKRCIKIYTKLSAVCKYMNAVAVAVAAKKDKGRKGRREGVVSKGLHFILSIDLKALPSCCP